MGSAFGQLFEAALKKAECSQLAFSKRVAINQGYLSRVIAGERLPPLDAVKEWITALELSSPNEAEELTKQAYLAHCPQWVQAYVKELESRLEATEAALKSQLQRDANAPS